MINVLLAIAITIQAIILVDDYVITWVKRAPRLLRLVAPARSATIVFGSGGSDFLKFVLQTVPEDATLVIPNYRVDEGKSNRTMWHVVGVMDYFLIPRRIQHCPCYSASDECLTCLQEVDGYVLGIGTFPPSKIVDYLGELFPYEYSKDWYKGVYRTH
jgi:hypothetical protein